jgi:hypothetical protein
MTPGLGWVDGFWGGFGENFRWRGGGGGSSPRWCRGWLTFVITAAIKASEGKIYRYPLTIRLIK